MLKLIARISAAIHGFRMQRALAAGYVPTILPYPGYGSPDAIRVLGRVLLTRRQPRQTEAEEAQAERQSLRGWRSFTSVPVGGAEVEVRAGGESFRIQADQGGVLDALVDVHLPAGWHQLSLSTGSSAPAEAPVRVVDGASTLGVVSDIDDTVMVTALPRPFLAAWNTFVLNEHARSPTPGMAVLMERLAVRHPDAPVIYLSTGAWNVAPTLTRFLSRNLYPAGALLLTDWGPSRERWFRSGVEHKRNNLLRLAHEFPGMRWILIGDDGQHDEQIYAEFARTHPERVAAVAIRQLSPTEAVLAGGRSGASDRDGTGGVPWVYAPDGAGLSSQLEALKLL